MAIKGKKQFSVENVLLAAAGGGAAGFVSDFAEKSILKDKPEIAAAIPAVVGAAIVYFVPNYEAAGYGMIGASAADFAGGLLDKNDGETMEGFNRATFKGLNPLKRGKMIRRMQKTGKNVYGKKGYRPSAPGVFAAQEAIADLETLGLKK